MQEQLLQAFTMYRIPEIYLGTKIRCIEKLYEKEQKELNELIKLIEQKNERETFINELDYIRLEMFCLKTDNKGEAEKIREKLSELKSKLMDKLFVDEDDKSK